MKILEMLKLGLILAIFAAAACVMLAFVYTGTSEVIAERQQADLENALKELFPEADGFEVIPDIKTPDEAVTIESAYAAIKKDLPYGAALTVTRQGFEKPIRTIVGVNTDGFITGVRILEHSETAGLGANAASEKYFVDRPNRITFYGQFTDKRVNDAFDVRDDVIAITASTITSRAVSDSVKAAALAAKAWLEGKEPDVITGATRLGE